MYIVPQKSVFTLEGYIDENYDSPIPLLLAELNVLAVKYGLELKATMPDFGIDLMEKRK